jgi:hypothetical protein
VLVVCGNFWHARRSLAFPGRVHDNQIEAWCKGRQADGALSIWKTLPMKKELWRGTRKRSRTMIGEAVLLMTRRWSSWRSQLMVSACRAWWPEVTFAPATDWQRSTQDRLAEPHPRSIGRAPPKIDWQRSTQDRLAEPHPRSIGRGPPKIGRRRRSCVVCYQRCLNQNRSQRKYHCRV